MIEHPQLEQLSAYLDGDVETTERARLDAHIASCAHCRQRFDALRTTLAELRDLDDEGPSEQDSWALRSAIAAARARDRRRYPRIAMAAAGAAAVIVGIAFAASGRHAAVKSSTENSALSVPMAVDATNFDERSAQVLLASAATGPVVTGEFSADSKAAGGTGATASNPRTASGRPLSGALQPQPASTQPLHSSAACAARLAPSGGGLVLQMQARFKGTTALFFIFAVPANDPARLELWVVSPACDVRYFAQRTVKR